MKILYTKVPAEICKKNRTFYKNHVRRAFIMFCAYEGYFDKVFTKSEVKKAKKGHLPEDCNIHHIMPLSGSADKSVHSFKNLVVLHKNTHERLNKEVFSPQLKPIQKAPYGSQIAIDVPDYEFVDVKGIKQERTLCCKMRQRTR